MEASPVLDCRAPDQHRPDAGTVTAYRGGRTALLTSLALAALAVVVFIEGRHSDRTLPNWDLTTYSLIGNELLHGRSLYADLWDHKPPAIYLSFAAAVRVAGMGERAIFLLWLVPTLATLAGCYYAGSAGFGRWGGLCAALFWTALCSDLGTQANEANAEVFMNACLIWAFGLLVREDLGRGWPRRSLLAGALLALASLYKPVIVVSAAALAAVQVLLPPQGERRRVLAQVVILAGVGAVIWIALFVYFAAVGRFADFYDTLFTYNRYYSGSVLHNLRVGFSRERLLPGCVHPMLPLLAAGLLGFCTDVWRRPRAWLLWLAFAVSAHCQTCLPGKFWAHYYQLWLPPLILGAGWGVVSLGRLLRHGPRVLVPLPALACLGGLLYYEVPNFRLTGEQWVRRNFGESYLQSRDMARLIETRLLRPGESFHQVGPHSELYFLTGRRPPCGMVSYMPWMFQGPLAEKFADRQRRQVNEGRTDLLVVTRWMIPLMPPSVARVFENYQEVEGLPDGPLRAEYSLWARNGSDCAARLRPRSGDGVLGRTGTNRLN